MSVQFYETIMGRRFYEGTMPKIEKDLEQLTKAVEKLSAQVETLTRELEEERRGGNADEA